MALCGALSLLQIVFLPGYLLLRTLRAGAGIVGTCILSFALSLVANHVLVAGLVVLKAYRPAVIYAIFAAELVLLAIGDRHRLRMGLAEAIAAARQRMRTFVRAIAGTPSFSVRRVLLAAAVLVIGGVAFSGAAQAGQIFQQWDAVVSWNRWAVDWAANRLPSATSIYPQLLPTNFSLSYVFMGSSKVWIFAKAFQFLFCLLLLLAMLDLARVEGKFGYVPGVVITYGLLVAILRFRMLGSGYADVPLAFFAFVSIYALLRARGTIDTRQQAKYLTVGAVLAAGAALTKQNGLYIAAIYPLLAWRFVLCGDGTAGLRRHLPALLPICSIMGLLVLPWYAYKFFDFHSGGDSNNTALLLTDFHGGRDLPHRLLYGGNLIAGALTPIGAALLLIAVAVSLRDPLQRWLAGMLVAPLGLIWALAFSYDLRNLAVIVPWVGAAAGIGATQIAAWIAPFYRSRLRPAPSARERITKAACRGMDLRVRAVSGDGLGGPSCNVGQLVGLLALVLITTCLCVSDDMLRDAQRRQQRAVGMAELNSQLYAFAANHPGQATIASDYQAMRWLPELGQRSVVCTCHEFTAFRQTFDRPDVRYVLVRMQGAAAEVRSFLQSQAAARFIFENHGFAFYEKRPKERVTLAASP